MGTRQSVLFLRPVDLSGRPVVADSPARRIRDLILWCGEFAKEIEWWFSLKDRTAYPQNLALRKPICIELYEYAHYLGWAIKEINRVTNDVNRLYTKTGRDTPLKGLGRSSLKTISDWKTKLRGQRNRFAAHRFTKKSGQFLSLRGVTIAIQGLNWKILCQAHTDLEDINQAVVAWLNDPMNKNHLVLAAQLRKSR